MGKGAAVKQQRDNSQLVAQLIDELITCPAFLHAFQAAVELLQALFPSLYRSSFEIVSTVNARFDTP